MTPSAVAQIEDRKSFSLNDLIREELATNPVADLHVLAKAITEQIPPRQLRAVIEDLLYSRLRTYIGNERTAIRHAAPDEIQPNGAAPSRWTGPTGHGSLYVRFLGERVQVAGETKFRRDCTLADIQTLRDQRLRLLEGLTVEAEREKKLAEALVRWRVATVGELAESIVLEIVQWRP
jgi:hypothetical protein